MADFYAVLEIAHDASDDDVTKAYRKQAMRYHPDRNNGSADAEERFKQVTEAYDVLKDPNKRAAYDRYGEAGLRGGGGGFHHVDLSEALNIFMRDFGAFGDAFGGRGATASRTGGDVKITMPLTLEEVASGVDKKVTVKLLEPCDACSTTGVEPGTASQTCATCSGSGEVRRAQRSFFGQFVTVAPCPTCRGEGRIVQTPCKKCKGEGRARAEKELTVHIPAGVATGQYMTLRGVGNAGMRGAGRGDVHVIFEVADDSRFERDGEDLFTEVLITFPQLVLGAEIHAPSVDGPLAVHVPPGTQSGTMFHLRGRGLPRVNGSGTGDLHVRVQAWTPDRLTAEQREVIERLMALQPTVPNDRREKGFWSKMKEALGA